LQLTIEVDELHKTLEELMTVTKCRWTVGKMEYYPSLSVGVTRFPDDGAKASDLLKNVEMALYKSKESGKSQAMFYEKRYEEDVQRLVYIENAISTVLQSGDFEIYYQPIYQLDQMSPRRFEALLRWKSSFKDITTGEFIEVAEKTGQILDIDRWVVRNAFHFSSTHFSEDHLKVSINLSAKSLKSPLLIQYIENEAESSGVNPSLVEFEITEHSLIDNFEFSLNIVNTLKNMGFGISLDDFGTRYSSLDYLRKIPFDTLKIDKSYIDKVTVTGKDRIIVEQIIHLANHLGLTTVAEGIETIEQKQILRELGCHLGQGYLMSKPICQKDVLDLVEQMRL
jgi:EAL domain-containing protein (putative c-di-GMP-specific phosphodiesterase class I)